MKLVSGLMEHACRKLEEGVLSSPRSLLQPVRDAHLQGPHIKKACMSRLSRSAKAVPEEGMRGFA